MLLDMYLSKKKVHPANYPAYIRTPNERTNQLTGASPRGALEGQPPPPVTGGAPSPPDEDEKFTVKH